jgi:anti-sigma factor RsiW
MAKLSDSILVAFVDGELDPGVSGEVAEALETDPDARERVNRLRQSAVLIRALFNQPEDRTITPELRRLLESRPARNYRKLAISLAASVVIVTAGFGGGWLAATRFASHEQASFEARLFDEVADYHTLYALEDEHQVEIGADHRQQIEDWLGSRLHRRLHIPDLSGRGLTFVGARLLVVDGAPVAQLVYHWPDQPHKPFALCVTFGEPGEQPLQSDFRDGVQQVLWRHRGYTYVLAGWSTQQVLTSIAAELMPILEKETS